MSNELSDEREELPEGWEWSTIGAACEVNKRDPKLRELRDTLPVSFVPMAAIDAEGGYIATPQVKKLKEVRKGFTPFVNNDVIFARITPCMENGKAAIARDLENGLGFGSTEFHVMRPTERVLSEWVFYFIRQQSFRNEAKANFSGTAGQLRVPNDFIRNYPLPLPPLLEQKLIVEKIEKLFAESRTAREALDAVPSLLKRFRQSVLAKAFRGELVEHDPNDEPASVLLERIKAEREKKKVAGKKYVEPAPIDTSELPQLPDGWEWVSVEQIAEVRLGRQRSPSRATGPNMRLYLRAANVRWDGLDLSDVKEMDFSPEEQKIFRLKRGDVLLAEASGSASEVGKPAVWNEELEECYFQNTLIRVRSEAPLPRYLYFHFLSDAIGAKFTQVTKGIGINHLGANGLSGWTISLPPLAEQRRIVAKIESLFAQADEIEQAVEVARRRAQQIDQAILARAFRGGM
ncbi:MAG: restriction endonuclease subunit S [Chloroflexi bacterium]|nr:restriction endonuclease subunit S [Chloroflexota bacterium]